MKTANLRRKHGISDVTFYNKKAECSGLEQSEAKRLRGREERERQAEETVRGSPRDGSYFMDELDWHNLGRSQKKRAVIVANRSFRYFARRRTQFGALRAIISPTVDRQLSLQVSMMFQWGVRRSSSAVQARQGSCSLLRERDPRPAPIKAKI